MPCQNGGTCTINNQGSTPTYSCTCTPGFTGPQCTIVTGKNCK